MTCAIERFEPRVGGRYRMVLTHQGAAHTPGKSSPHADVVEGEFVELVPDGRVVQRVVFESDDPAFAGAITITSLAPVSDGTEVVIHCADVPAGISQGRRKFS
jgi:uncharacterized protein YndB with AHSA1/START domain